ncbi:MAG: DegT/DnrJ/EryC1/StrS family aminotransferase [Oscillospiraceae bacterium]|nr:DegT/DnrJ/EryC1/StrS family aminotransferase [Oscillospiraceae bacterium]
MAFNDLNAQYLALKSQIDSNVLKAMASGSYIMGPEVRELEQKLCDYTGAKHCISCSNGTDALLMPLMAWGVGAGDAVFVPAFTFISTSEVVAQAGATPVFCDVDKRSFNLDPESLRSAIKKVQAEGRLYPRAVIAVDLFGLPFDYEAINAICTEFGLLLIEDGAQGFGGEINGRKACTFGDVSTTSFFPAKPLGCYGDGGAIFTDDEGLKRKLLSIRVHGKQDDENDPNAKYHNVRVGLNARLDTLQAAILLPKLEAFDTENAARRKAASLYSKLLAETELITPLTPQGYASSWAQYTLIAKDTEQREHIISALKVEGIPAMIYYPKPLHLQPTNSGYGYKEGSLPVSEDLCRRVFSLPMHGYITEEIVERVAGHVVRAVESFFNS